MAAMSKFIPLGLIATGLLTEPICLLNVVIYKTLFTDLVSDLMPCVGEYSHGTNNLPIHYAGLRELWDKNKDIHWSKPFSAYAQGSFQNPIVFNDVNNQIKTLSLDRGRMIKPVQVESFLYFFFGKKNVF